MCTERGFGFSQVPNAAVIRALMKLDAFNAIPTGGKEITADELAAKTGCEKALLSEFRY